MSTPGSDPATPPVMVRYAVSTRSVRVGMSAAARPPYQSAISIACPAAATGQSLVMSLPSSPHAFLICVWSTLAGRPGASPRTST